MDLVYYKISLVEIPEHFKTDSSLSRVLEIYLVVFRFDSRNVYLSVNKCYA